MTRAPADECDPINFSDLAQDCRAREDRIDWTDEDYVPLSAIRERVQIAEAAAMACGLPPDRAYEIEHAIDAIQRETRRHRESVAERRHYREYEA